MAPGDGNNDDDDDDYDHDVIHSNAIEPPVNGHPRDKKKCPFKRGVRLWEVKNVVFVYS